MKKIIYLILFSLFLNVNLAHATVGWSKNIPATSENPQAISPDVIENNTALDLMLQNYRDGGVYVKLISTSEIDIGPGGVMLSNSGGSTRLMVANASLTAMSSTNIDTGSISPSSTYYIYAYASSTTATTFSVIYSASSTSPTGITYYAKLGSFTTDGSSNFSGASSNIVTSPTPTSNGTAYSANVQYQNVTGRSVEIIWLAQPGNSGGWTSELNTACLIGSSSASTQVAGSYFSNQAGSSLGPESSNCIVPNGWYWEITNSATTKSVTGSISRIEQWQL